jgi:hypothetical protein
MKLKINELKELMLNHTSKCLENGWITATDANIVIAQIEADELTIGVIGQMNIGKSSLLNALVFGEEVLPVSETPMTATLTYIKHGEKFSAEIETISKSDYEEICRTKDLLPNTDVSEEEINAAKDLYEKISTIPNFQEKLGATFTLSGSEYEEYIGANGLYTAISKYVTLTIPNNNLKGINIVDTPGFNDPVSSRDLTTKKFLSRANIIVFVQNALSAFTKSDIDLMKEQLPKSGIGKMVIALNKKDLLQKSDLDRIIIYVNNKKSELINAPENIGNLSELLRDCPIIPISGIMASVGIFPDEYIANNETLSFFKERLEFDFPELKKVDYLRESGLVDLEETISGIVLRGKAELIVKAPCTKLQAFLHVQLNKLTYEKEQLEQNNEILSDKSLDFESILQDLKIFEKSTTLFMTEVIDNAESNARRQIAEKTHNLKTTRDLKIRNISFLEKRSKKHLGECYTAMDGIYREFNTEIRNLLYNLGNNISDMLIREINIFERKLNDIILTNAEIVHNTVMARIRRVIRDIIPDSVADIKGMTERLPDWTCRDDIYTGGIKLYFRSMISKDYDDAYFDKIMQPFKDSVETISEKIENGVKEIILSTKEQFNSNSIDEENDIIEQNNVRMKEIDIINSDINQMINTVSNLI